jgi:hypothetical protein
MKALKLFFAILLLMSCRTQKPSVSPIYIPGTPITITKSEIIYRDTILHIPADSASLTALIRCDSLNRAYMQIISGQPGQRTRLNSRLYGDTLKINATIDSFAIYHRYKQRIENHVTTSENKIIYPEQPKENPKIYNLMEYLIIIIALIAIIGTINIVGKRKSDG